MKQYDETAETLIKEPFLKESVSNDVNQVIRDPFQSTITETLIDMLKFELVFKNRQITKQQPQKEVRITLPASFF